MSPNKRRHNHSSRKYPPRFISPSRPSPRCSVCGYPIKDILTALSLPSSGGEPAHFDCILKQASEKLELQAGEKIIYLGKGQFAVVEAKAYNKKSLKILRQLSWEDAALPLPWREKLKMVIH